MEDYIDDIKKSSDCLGSGVDKKLLRCDFCNYKTEFKVGLEFHMNKSHNNQEIKCEKCNKVFTSISKHNEHQLETHSRLFDCLMCNDRFKNYDHVLYHVKTVHFKENKVVFCTCDICGIEYYSALHMENHMKNFHIARYKCIDETCREGFNNYRKMKQHYSKIHLKRLSRGRVSRLKKEKTFCCNLCGYRTAVKNSLNSHMKSKHTINECICRVCNKIYANKVKLRIHTRSVHENRSEFVCSICNATYKIYQKLSQHIERKHPLEKESILQACHVCSAKYYTKSKLDTHVKNEHSGRYKCLDSDCKRSFNCTINRRKHYLYSHSSDREVN